jgi:membrane associated rhomboid family serine protease
MDDPVSRLLTLSAPALLIGSVVIVSCLAWIFPPARRAMILVPYRVVRHGEVHRLLTAGWLHADAWHLAVNMFTLYYFAREALRPLGPPRFLALYVSAVIVAFLPTTLRRQRDPGYASLGASGAVAAVMLSAILLNPTHKLLLFFLPIPIPGPIFALGYIAYSILHSLRSSDGVNHAAHLSGALYGVVLTWFFEPAKVERTIRMFF